MYPHRDEQDAAAAVDLVASRVRLEGHRVLDLACGPGRHADLIRNHGCSVFGVDLSMPLLRKARRDFSPPIAVARGDMRYPPFESGAFGVVVNLFTSFGYFESDLEHLAVLREVARVLQPGGRFVIDYLNSTNVAGNLVEKEQRVLGGRQVSISRRISDDGRFVFKEMVLLDGEETFTERVRLFDPEELQDLVGESGFELSELFGSYDGEEFRPDSPRLILFSERK